MSETIERCRAEQERCKQHLADPTLSEDEKKGAMLGLDDWFFEELLETEYMQTLKAPFPWFGGKSRVAPLVWDRFGNVPNYVEPFFGSGAVLLGRPHSPGTETVNDKDCYLANFWRALQAEPDELAAWADWPVNEADLLARHNWLLAQADFQERMRTDPHYHDAKIAGWWVWGLSAWIGSGWCVQKSEQLPHLGNAGRGDHIRQYFQALAARLRDARVACGEWQRVCTEAVTLKNGQTAVFLDPPYTEGSVEYSAGGGGGDVAHAVREWALEWGSHPDMRIALCGYEGEHAMPETWECVPWKARKGYQNTKATIADRGRERIWFSPHCLKLGLFAGYEAETRTGGCFQ